MISVENVEIWGWKHAIRGMRNPFNSWGRSDSTDGHIGENDLALMQTLFKGGTEHRKFLRQIMVSLDITAPLYWWKEFDTYKVGITADSCSTMHTIAARGFTREDFSLEHLDACNLSLMDMVIDILNLSRSKYMETQNKSDWWQLIQLLPSSYNQRRTVTMNYENVFSIIRQRTGHKLDEWNELVTVFLELPYVREIGGLAR